MLSKHANICFDVSDNMTMLELNSSTEILNEYFEDMKKQAEEASKAAESGDGGTHSVSVSDSDVMNFLP